MKKIYLLFFILIPLFIAAQEPYKCSYRTKVKDEVISLKTTREYLIHEKLFMDNGEFVFFCLSISEGVPMLIVQIYQRNIYFTKPLCFDYKSRIYFQLNNGNYITLVNTGDDTCGPLEIDKNSKKHIRKLTGNFVFTGDSFNLLKESGISLMRIKYRNEIVDYFVQKELNSQVYQGNFEPESYFMNYAKCLD
jgi:hypothetical protein